MMPADALVAFDRAILEAYSRRTTDALRALLPLRIALPGLESFLALNVAKEVQKDALVIRRAGELLCGAGAADAALLHELYRATQEIDSAFLARATVLPVRIVIRYEEIGPIRMRRIERLLAAAVAILAAWQQQRRGARAALGATHSREELECLLLDLLQLYARETRALSRSLRLPAPLVPLREIIGSSLQRVMDETALRLTRELAATAYRRGRT